MLKVDIIKTEICNVWQYQLFIYFQLLVYFSQISHLQASNKKSLKATMFGINI